MKKVILSLSLLLLSTFIFAQQVENQFYFRVGYSNPSWKHFDLDKQDWNDAGIESKAGANFELGSIFLIKSILDRDDMAFGINVDYLYAIFHNFKSENDFYDTNLGIFRAGSKIGPSFTYSPVDKLEFDICAKADFAWGTGAVTYYDDMIDDADEFFISKVDFGFSTGLNIRYGILMLGAEFNTLSAELESDDYPGTYLQQAINEGVGKNPNEKASKLPCMNFTIGLSF
ncbi:hypothetical protein [uncultured Draconibacterium sp.]|uniref:hypothetical protein n=1 Tax=uncultured Draconibacterium sp. TaxID=1573823 RepID=UPI0025D0F69C|nr:hypothetical protein [uncultured Draconibacterium sp.]